jgi:hypothetical protein
MSDDPVVDAARVGATATLDAARINADATNQSSRRAGRWSMFTALFSLLGSLFTGGAALATDADDKAPPAACSVTHAATTASIADYARMAEQGAITVQQSRRLTDDAIAEQVSQVCPR